MFQTLLPQYLIMFSLLHLKSAVNISLQCPGSEHLKITMLTLYHFLCTTNTHIRNISLGLKFLTKNHLNTAVFLPRLEYYWQLSYYS